jgi:hypothetical protein
MRVHFLPFEQQKRNDKATEKLRRIGYLLFALSMATVALGARLYLWSPDGQAGPQFTSDDGRTIYSDAIVLAADFVLSPVKIVGSAEFVAPGERRRARSLSSTALPDGTEITLLRLETATSIVPVTVTVLEVGDALAATARGGQEWRGSVRGKVEQAYSVEPEFALPAGTAVYRDSDRTALVGFGIRTTAAAMVVAAKDVVAHFPELHAGR